MTSGAIFRPQHKHDDRNDEKKHSVLIPRSAQIAVEKCVEAEEAVKTGRMNDKMSVEILILSVL